MCYQALRKLLNNQSKRNDNKLSIILCAFNESVKLSNLAFQAVFNKCSFNFKISHPEKKKDQNKAKTIPNYTDNKREMQNLMRKDREGTSFLLLQNLWQKFHLPVSAPFFLLKHHKDAFGLYHCKPGSSINISSQQHPAFKHLSGVINGLLKSPHCSLSKDFW